MAFAQKGIKHSHSVVWTFLVGDLHGGHTEAIDTGIRLVNKNGSYVAALDSCRCLVKIDSKVGVPVVPDPELTEAGGHLIVTIQNTAPPGNNAGGQMEIEYLHSARR